MLNLIKFLLLFSPISTLCFSQNADLFKLTRSDLVGMEETKRVIYNETNIAEYNATISDLYIEFGMKELLAQSFVWETEPFKIEVFVMNSSEAAFGLFSLMRSKCKANGTVGNWDCINASQVKVAQGNVYISVIALNGSYRSPELATQVAKKLVAKYKTKSMELPTLFSNPALKINKSGIKLVFGKIGMKRVYPSLEPYFTEAIEYKVWIVPVTSNSITSDLILAVFQSVEECQAVHTKVASGEDFITEVNGKNLLIFKRSDGAFKQEIFQILESNFRR
jgi:hypothetical protein